MITYFHLEQSGGRCADIQRQNAKDQRVAGSRCTESQSGESCRPQVQGKRVLRSARHSSGKIRNVAMRSHRKIFSDRCGERIWHLKAYILPNHGKLRREGIDWFSAQKTWSPWPQQIEPGDIGFSQQERRAWPTDACAAPRIFDSASIRPGRSSEVDRTRVMWKKNSTLNSIITLGSLIESDAVLAAYETMRRSAFGEVLLPESRNGLCLFIRQGMWRWARDFASTEIHQTNSKAYQRSVNEHNESPLIHAFASMVLHCDNRSNL